MHIALKPVALGLCLAMALSGCATTSNKNLTPEEIKMREQANTYNQTIAEGALVGCAAGALIGALVASKNDRLAGAAIGCGAGGLVGGGAGAYVANKQENYANKEDQINAMIEDVRLENKKLGELNASVRQVVAQDKARINQIDADLASGAITMKEAKNRIASVDENTKYIDNTLTELRKRRDTYDNAAYEIGIVNKKQSREMTAEITKLEAQIAQMEAERNALVERRTVSRVG